MIMVEELRSREQLFIRFTRTTNHKLRAGGRPTVLPCRGGIELAADAIDEPDGPHEVLLKMLIRREGRKASGVGRFEVDRNPISETHGSEHLSEFGSGHDLEVNVRAVIHLIAQDLGCADEAVLCACTSTSHRRTEEDTLDETGAGEIDYQTREGKRLEGDTAEIATGAHGAVEAVVLAHGGEKRLEESGGPAVGHDCVGEDDAIQARATCDPAAILTSFYTAGRGEQFEFAHTIHTPIIEHSF